MDVVRMCRSMQCKMNWGISKIFKNIFDNCNIYIINYGYSIVKSFLQCLRTYINHRSCARFIGVAHVP